jgi:homoisocitrate dehydrogenase
MSAAPYTILVIPGDGIGREVIPAAVAVLRATGLPFHFENADAGWECFQRQGEALPSATLTAARAADAILFGAVASPGYPVAGYRSPIVRLRRELDLYANIRPVFDDLPENGSNPRRRKVDLVVVRENTEDVYAGRERVEDDGTTAIAERVVTPARQLAHHAHRLRPCARPAQRTRRIRRAARKGDRRSQSECVARNVRTVPLRRAGGRTGVPRSPRSMRCWVDTCALQLATRPERFDVIVTTNLFGDYSVRTLRAPGAAGWVWRRRRTWVNSMPCSSQCTAQRLTLPGKGLPIRWRRLDAPRCFSTILPVVHRQTWLPPCAVGAHASSAPFATCAPPVHTRPTWGGAQSQPI